jgi:hypothetical protein
VTSAMAIDLAAARRIVDAATPGPWQVTPDYQGGKQPHDEQSAIQQCGPVDNDGLLVDVVSCIYYDGNHLVVRPGDATFIAESRQLLPAAIDEIEQLRAEVERLKTPSVACHGCERGWSMQGALHAIPETGGWTSCTHFSEANAEIARLRAQLAEVRKARDELAGMAGGYLQLRDDNVEAAAEQCAEDDERVAAARASVTEDCLRIARLRAAGEVSAAGEVRP